MSIRLILLDIDGTLTNSKKVITPKTAEALLKAQASGIRLCLASGRAACGLKQYAKVLDMFNHDGLYVCNNGATVMNCQSGEVYFNKALTVEESQAVLAHIKNFEVVPMINDGDYFYVYDVFNNTINFNGKPFRVMEYESRGNNCLLCEKDLQQFIDFPVNKILTFGQPEYLQEVWQQLREPFIGKINCMFTSPFYYEYTAKDIDKTEAVKQAILPLGYKQEEIMAFGDAQNDLSMIKFAHIGVAMGNAVDEVKQVADYVTASNDEDGIAEAIYHFLPELKQISL